MLAPFCYFLFLIQTTTPIGDTVTFSYNINNATSKYIGIDRAGGSRYSTLNINSENGTANYTFTEPGTYCCIVEGSNNIGYNCSSGVYVTVIASSPKNCTIKSNVKGNISVGDTVTFNYNIEGATYKGIGIDSNGSRYFSQGVNSDNGTFSYTFTKSGTYCCIIEGYNNNGYNCSSGIYITVDSLSNKSSITANYTSIGVGDTVTLDYNIIGATEYKGIGIDIAGGSRYTSFSVNAEKGKATYTFSQPGTYCCIVEGRTSQEYFCSDGIYITVIDSPPKNCSITASKKNITIGDTVNFNYNIQGATAKCIGIDKAGGSRYANVGTPTDKGTTSYTFTEAGTYCCIIEGYNNVGYNCSDGVYITVEPLSNKFSISAPSNEIAVGDTVTFSYSIVGQLTYKGIGIDIAGGDRYASFEVNDSSGNASFTFTKPGVYCCIIEGYNAFDYGCSQGVYIYVNPKYTVYFDANDGETALYTKEVIYNSPYGDLPILIRNGYSFKGWYTAYSGGTQITKETIVNTNSDITLYAQWEKLTPYTQTKKVDNNNYSVELLNLDSGCTVIFATYQNNRLVELYPATYDGNKIPFATTKQFDTIKVMAWSNFTTLKPLCEVNSTVIE